MSKDIYRKVCKTPEKRRKEAGVLAFLTASEVSPVVPKVVAKRQTDESVLETFRIEGDVLTEADLCSNLMRRLGVLAKAVHRIGEYHCFGSLNENLSIQDPADSFSDFISRQIQNWIDWHRAFRVDEYVFVYAEWLQRSLDDMRPYFDLSRPLFCHGDFDLKNILIRSGSISGLVDWEHAGAYCLEWELRKLSRFFRQRPGFLEAFLEGYYGKVPDSQLAMEHALCFMEATDLLGHLRWCTINGMESEIVTTISRMHSFFQIKEAT